MPKIARVTQKIFASAATNNGVIGSGQDGTKVLTQDLATLMAKPAYLNGWLDMILGASKFPPLEEFQALEYIANMQIAYLFQEGVPEYDAGTTYYIGSIVKKTGTFQLYGSLTNANTGHALTDTANWQLLIDFSAYRIRLITNATYYVNGGTGNDANPGTLASPWATIQHGINYVAQNLDLNGNTVQINVAAGTYTGANTAGIPFVGGNANSVTITGDVVTPANVIVSTTNANCFSAAYACQLNVGGFKFLTAGSGHALSAVGAGAALNVTGKCEFGAVAAGSSHMLAQQDGNINISANYNITGNATNHYSINNGGNILVTSPSIVLTGTPAFTNFALVSTGLIAINSTTTTFTGTATGTRYSVNANGIINTTGSGGTFLPGNAAGVPGTGGQYI